MRQPLTHEQALPQYKSIFGDLQALIIRNEAREKNELTTAQLKELKKALDILEQQHSASTFTREFVPPAKASIDQIFRAILKLELAKRES